MLLDLLRIKLGENKMHQNYCNFDLVGVSLCLGFDFGLSADLVRK